MGAIDGMTIRTSFIRLAAVLAISCAALDAAELVLPVAEVRLVPDYRTKACAGRVVPVEKVDVVPQVSGEILEVGFANGAEVKEGDLLYRLDDVKYRAAAANAAAKVEECKAGLSYAELSYARHKQLVASRAVSQDALDNALSARDSARATLAAAESELIRAGDDLKHCRITAPVSGRIGTTAFTKGNYVTPSSGTLVTLVRTSPIRVRFALSNREYLGMFGAEDSRIVSEAEVALQLADDRRFEEKGTVEYVENTADELTDTISVYALFKNDKCVLKPGGVVKTFLSAQKGVPTPAIPPTAALMNTQGPYVWVVDAAGKPSIRHIARGDVVGDWLFVEKGLKVGERVVSQGAHKVTANCTIRAAK